MAPQKVQFVGASCGKHGTHTFYKAFKYLNEGKFRILTLGEFFFLKISDDSPVCIGELQLLWENQSDTELLCSIRLYFLPENTPEGKQEFHGEDEILSISEKLVLKLEDLVTLIVDHVEWTAGREPYQMDDITSSRDSPKLFPATSCKLSNSHDITSTHVIILSYPQYCRYRAVLKRLENVADKWLKNAIVRAIGGITSPHANTPNLKGRPRKKRSSTQDSNQDSDETSSEKSLQISQPVKVKMGKRMSALRNGYRFDKDLVSKDEQSFLFSLHKFMKKQYPHWVLDKISTKRLWKHLYDKLGGDPSSTSAATCTRRHYEKLLWPYEKHVRGDTDINSHGFKRKKAKFLANAKNDVGNRFKSVKRESYEENGGINKEDGIIKRKRRFKDRFINLHEKVKQWEKLRKLKAVERDKLKRVVSHPKTVKNLLDNPALQEEIGSSKVKLEKVEGVKEEPNENKVPLNSVKSAIKQTDVKVKTENTSITSKSLVNNVLQNQYHHQSNGDTHVEKQDKVQSEKISAKTPDTKHSSLPSPGFLPFSSSLPLMGGHPAAMFYPPAFMPMGASHHSVPSSPFRSSSPSPTSMKCLMTPPAHMNGLKRPYSASPMSHIPSPYRPPFANKSLLFDFESPKRPKVENISSNTKNSLSDIASQDSEQPTDLSMKTLRKLESFVKKETQKLNGNSSDAVDLRCYSTRVSLDSPQDLSKKMPHSSHKLISSSSSSKTNNISVPHIPGTRTESPHNVLKKSKPSVFSHPSQLFNKDSKIQPSGDSKVKSLMYVNTLIIRIQSIFFPIWHLLKCFSKILRCLNYKYVYIMYTNI
ncbi:hypothetical protein KUTeg_004982 [Tegillarca granosa]|uniref:ARID domain-containing protein n=1 Tax=Tegillarca granosa TaxID=220873 RepID=A0ABQ9FIG7_TEGGR|nr:hypothetical protein KUTeg_004982 [Tegillarca granosa]